MAGRLNGRELRRVGSHAFASKLEPWKRSPAGAMFCSPPHHRLTGQRWGALGGLGQLQDPETFFFRRFLACKTCAHLGCGCHRDGAAHCPPDADIRNSTTESGSTQCCLQAAAGGFKSIPECHLRRGGRTEGKNEGHGSDVWRPTYCRGCRPTKQCATHNSSGGAVGVGKQIFIGCAGAAPP